MRREPRQRNRARAGIRMRRQPAAHQLQLLLHRAILAHFQHHLHSRAGLLRRSGQHPDGKRISTSTPTTAPQEASSSKPVPVAAIAAPVVIGVLAIAGIVVLLFFLRRRKAAAKLGNSNPYAPPTCTEASRGAAHGDVHELLSPAREHEVAGDAVKYRYELESRPAELDGGGARKG